MEAKRRHRLAYCVAASTAKEIDKLLLEALPDLEKVRFMVDNLKLEILDLKAKQQDLIGLIEKEDDVEVSIDSYITERSHLEDACQRATKWVNLKDVANRVSSVGSVDSGRSCRIKLPDLSLPSFNGDSLRWTEYWDSMNSNIITNSELQDVDKFAYLRSTLKGEAAELIAGLPTDSKAFSQACDLLQKEYARTDKIEAAHFLELLRISAPPRAKGKEKLEYKGLREFRNKIATNVRCLSNLGVDCKEYERMALHHFFSILPAEFRAKWYAHQTNRCMQAFLDFIDQQLQTLDNTGLNTPSVAPVTSVTKPSKSVVASASALHNATTPQPNKVPKCLLCNKRHDTERCWSITRIPPSERADKIKKSNLCLRCLKNNHVYRECPAVCSICSLKHHSLLCFNKTKGEVDPATKGKQSNAAVLASNVPSFNAPVSEPNAHAQRQRAQVGAPVASTHTSDSESFQSLHVGVTFATDINTRTVLQTAKVKVLDDKGNKIEANVLFDSGADRSFISSKFLKRVKAKWVRTECMPCNSFGGHSTDNFHNIFNISLCDLQGGYHSLFAAEVPLVAAPLCRFKVPTALISEFSGIEWADDYCNRDKLLIDILIGQDSYWQFTPKTPSIQKQGGLVAIETVFGWILSGSWSAPRPAPVDNVNLLLISDVSDEELRKFWDLEHVGVSSKEEALDPFIHDPHLKRFSETTKFSQGRYEVALPWKSEQAKANVVDNFKLAEKRFIRTEQKLEEDPQLKAQYDQVFKDYVNEGFIEEVPPEQINTGYPIFYLPHRPVVKESSTTTKVRPVFDASCKSYNNISLNDCLHTGPSLNPDLVKVLVRFRRWKHALACDIKKAFLQIVINPEERDVHRFLLNLEGTVKTMRFTRVPFGLTSSPFLLNATVKYHLKSCNDSLVVRELMQNLYVDDWLTGANSLEEVDLKFQEAEQILKGAGMTLIKCSSTQLGFSDKGNADAPDVSTKVLGLKWCLERDCFSYEGIVSEPPPNLLFTKRTVLSLIARFFDPIGYLSPFIQKAKIIFQNVWRKGLDWDEPLPVNLQEEFHLWTQSIPHLKDWYIERSYFSETLYLTTGLELHAFGDASEQGYGACLYLRAPLPDGSFKVTFCMARARVSPIKRITLPRLELMGAVLCARLVDFVKATLELDDKVKISCYTDSKVTLDWIKGNANRWKTFVGNRVAEIQQLVAPNHWHFCPGKDNPADCLTRGMLAQDIVKSDLWRQGPPWLSLSEKPEESPMEENIVLPQEEMRASSNFMIVQGRDYKLLNLSNWSTLTRAINVLAYVRRFFNNCKRGAVRVSTHNPTLSERVRGKTLTHAELTRAKFDLIKWVQMDAYSKEISLLRENKPILRSSSLINIDPFLDDSGVLRVMGRLENAELSFSSKHPIIVPHGPLAKLLIEHQHIQLKHSGTSTLLSTLRNEFWIIGARRLAKSVVNKCIACKRIDARLCKQAIAPLPKLRVNTAPPFSISGLDHCGPLYCADSPGKKYYILLFTCAVVRAIHLEMTDSLNISDCVLAIKRFCARRGSPSVIYSDNAKTFQGVAKLLRQKLGVHCPEWKFILPLSPWWGGWWERLVRSVKSSLKKSLGIRSLTKVELETCIFEIEACINSRPLTFVGSVPDVHEVLTPSKFLIGRTAGHLLEIDDIPCQISASVLNDREMLRQQRLNQFWSLWSSEYLRNLPPAAKGFVNKCQLKIGSIVLVKEDNLPRLKWPLGIIVEVLHGRDGLIRGVKVKTSKGEYLRPIQRLLDLEISSVGSGENENVEAGPTEVNAPERQDASVPQDVNQPVASTSEAPVPNVNFEDLANTIPSSPDLPSNVPVLDDTSVPSNVPVFSDHVPVLDDTSVPNNVPGFYEENDLEVPVPMDNDPVPIDNVNDHEMPFAEQDHESSEDEPLPNIGSTTRRGRTIKAPRRLDL